MKKFLAALFATTLLLAVACGGGKEASKEEAGDRYQLSGEIDRIRDRMRSVRGVRLGRYRAGSTGNGHRARTRA